jgi:hypothetical protein
MGSTLPSDQGPGLTDHSREAVGIEALRRAGFTASFTIEGEGDRLREVGSGRAFSPQDVRIVDHYRFEGTSDPDDLSVIYALEAGDGTRGLLVDAYGSYADPRVGAILDRMSVERRPEDTGWFRRRGPWIAAAAVAVGLLALAATGRWPHPSRR